MKIYTPVFAVLLSFAASAQNVGIGTTTPTARLQVDQTGSSPALRITINNAASVTPGLFVVTNAQGGALEAVNTATTGLMNGVAGVASSNSLGSVSSGVSGVLGISQATSGGLYSAGIRGINYSTSTAGMGVIGYHAGGGTGVYGEGGIGVLALANGTNSYGLLARSQASDDVALMAEYTGSGIATAAIIKNGRLKVAGTNKFAFKHTVTVQNVLVYTTQIDNPVCDGDPNAIIIVTHEYKSPGSTQNITVPVRVYYNANNQKWNIATEDNSAFSVGTIFNVIVVNQ